MIRFVVLTTQRSGSTLFCETLDQSPRIYCMQECCRYDLSRKSPYSFSHFLHQLKIDFQSLPPEDRTLLLAKYLDTLTAERKGVKAIGFKVMYDQLDRMPEIQHWMMQRSARVIHLMRANLLKRLVSWIVLKKATRRANSNQPLPQVRVRIETHELIDLLHDMALQVAHHQQMFSHSFPYMETNYEHFIRFQKRESDRVGAFLALGSLGYLKSDLVKVNSDSLRDVIANYDEVAEVLRGSPFAQFLDAPGKRIGHRSQQKVGSGRRWKYQQWSIGIYKGASPFVLQPAKGLKNPVLTAADVTDIPAQSVADPFMICETNIWYMFFEVMNAITGRGEIGLATSIDGLEWHYQQKVLKESFHLSYPYVFKWNRNYYMIPETRTAGCGVRLYQATEFPYKWSFVQKLLPDDYADASLIRYRNTWWLFALKARDILTLHFAKNLTGPWVEHPRSPLLQDKHIGRPGGRLVVFQNRLIRYAQDGVPLYGSRVWALEIERLTPTDYCERLLSDRPVLEGSGQGWNAGGMHHIDALRMNRNRWIACVDGFQIQTEEWSTQVWG